MQTPILSYYGQDQFGSGRRRQEAPCRSNRLLDFGFGSSGCGSCRLLREFERRRASVRVSRGGVRRWMLHGGAHAVRCVLLHRLSLRPLLRRFRGHQFQWRSWSTSGHRWASCLRYQRCYAVHNEGLQELVGKTPARQENRQPDCVEDSLFFKFCTRPARTLCARQLYKLLRTCVVEIEVGVSPIKGESACMCGRLISKSACVVPHSLLVWMSCVLSLLILGAGTCLCQVYLLYFR